MSQPRQPRQPRIDTVRRAWADAEKPKPGPRVARGMSLLEIAGEVVRAEKEPRVGGMTKVLHALPPAEQRQVREVMDLYAHERDLGRHGNPKSVLDAFDVPPDIAEATCNGLEVDYVAAELQRRRPSDIDRPLPELTRRDYIDAAMTAVGRDTHDKDV